MACELLDLPTELLVSIIDYIIRPTDLKSLCCSCKSLAEYATKQLYFAVAIDVDKASIPDGSGFLISGNRGHQYVRVLSIDADRSKPDDGAKSEKPAEFLRAALQVLPKDQLMGLL